MSSTPECRRTVTVKAENGLHLAPCSVIAKLAQTFRSEVRIRNGEKSGDAKSVLDLMVLGAGYGTTLQIEARGDDAEPAVDQLAQLFETNFEVGDHSAA